MTANTRIRCRPMEPTDFGVVPCGHWESAGQIREFIDRQGIASMLAFDGPRCVGNLHLREYAPEFCSAEGWTGGWPWADFQIGEPLGLQGRYLTLGCYHVGELPDGGRDSSLWGRGIGTALLKAAIEWYRAQDAIDGLLSWALVPGSKEILQWAGQMPHTVYERLGFREIKRVRDPRLDKYPPFREYTGGPNATSRAADPAVLRVMLLTQGTR